MRRSPRNLQIACNHAGLTHFGGIYFFHEFMRVLQLRKYLARHLDVPCAYEPCFGDYIGAYATAKRFHVAWADGRKRHPDAFSGGVVFPFS